MAAALRRHVKPVNPLSTRLSHVDDLTTLRGRDLLAGYRTHAFSPSEVVDAAFRRIDATKDVHNAFITVCEESARTVARHLDAVMMSDPERITAGFGVPLSVKDISATAGIKTTRGAARTSDWVPDFDAAAVGRLRRSGAVVIGKTNTSESAWKAEGSNPTFGTSYNPWVPELTPGGSSGGAGIATAMRYSTWAVGTDGFGSIRVPASFCHVVGFKPTLGSVPYVPVSSEFLSHIGPLTRTVDDARDAYLLMAGHDSRDPLSQVARVAGPPVDRPLRIGVLTETDNDPVAAPIIAAFDQFAAWLQERGHHLEPICLPPGGADIIGPILIAFAAAELQEEEAAELSVRDPDLVSLTGLAAHMTVSDLAIAQTRRIEYFHSVLELFDNIDYLISPTVSNLPFPAGQHSPVPYNSDVAQWHRWCSMTYPWNLAGNPAISIPWTRAENGAPIGVQIIGRHHNDLGVLAFAANIESERPWHADYGRL